jgi:GTP-binding protein
LGVVHLVDSRHLPTEDDLRMIEFLADLEIPTLVVLTKVDKLSATMRAKQLPALAEALQVDPDQLLPFSSKTGEGREDLLESIEALLQS